MNLSNDLAAQAQGALETLLTRAVACVRGRVSRDGRLDAARIEAEQHAVHGLAWLATYVEAVRQLAAYAERMRAEGRFGETEELLTRIGLGEYLAQAFGGIPMNQGEFVRLADFGLDEAVVAALRQGAVAELIADRLDAGATAPRLAALHRARAGRRRSAIPASTRRWRRCAPRCAASPTPR